MHFNFPYPLHKFKRGVYKSIIPHTRFPLVKQIRPMGTRPETLKGKCQCAPYRTRHLSRRAWCIEQEAEFLKLTSVFPCRRIHNPLVLYTRLLKLKTNMQIQIPHFIFSLREFRNHVNVDAI
jgi:hypothetical protein